MLMLFVLPSALCAYPHTYTNCGVTTTITAPPQRIITMNQGATEFLLGLGLADRMVGTAYLDDAIWPQYESDFNSIPVLSTTYPTEEQIMALNPDFIMGAYNSAFREQYVTSSNQTRGIFSNDTVGPCDGAGSSWGEGVLDTCRPQLHAASIATYLLADACEDTSLRPDTVSEEIVYQELRQLGAIFDVAVESVIDEMLEDFDAATVVLNTIVTDAPLKAMWFDCVGCCGSHEVFVGGGTGAPQMLMTESGLTNAFADLDGNWVCVNRSQIAIAAPDVIVLVDAAWDSVAEKIGWLYNQTELCNLNVLQSARFVNIPFSASTLGPRNGQAALDMARAVANLHIGPSPRSQSGVNPVDTMTLAADVAGLNCNFNDAMTSTFATKTTTTTAPQVDAAVPSMLKLTSMLAVLIANFL